MTQLDPCDGNATLLTELANHVAALGREHGLPYVAASADLSSPDPMLGADGRPLVETTFRWVNPELRYWNDRGFALRAPFVLAARYCAEPFFFADGRFATWRPAPCLETIDAADSAREHGVAAAIIAPAYLTGGVIGAVVWASSEPIDVRTIFAAQAPAFHAAALRFLAAYQDAHRPGAPTSPVRLTRREIQCLKWAAAGKTDALIGEIVRIATPTVRFHLKNAANKLQVASRSQAVQRAAALGYIGPSRGGAPFPLA